MKKILCMMLMLLTLGMSGFAQTLGDYTFSTGTDATKWITLTSTTSLITPGAGDYGVSTVHDIGFSFTFGSQSYTQFSVNADGNLRLGSTVTGTANYSTPFSTANAVINNPKINMLGCDGFLSDSGHVYHEVVGTAPNRVCVIEIFTSTYSTTSRNSLLRWQVQLFEGSNDIQIVFASTAPPILPAVVRQPGMCVNGSDVILVNSNHQATHFTVGQSTTISSGNWPDVNRYYHFAAPVVTCPAVSGLSASNITPTSFDLSWVPVGTETNWDLYVSTSPVTPDSNTTPSDYVSGLPEYSFTSLTPNTTYYVYVRANCGSGDESYWASYTVATPCNPVSSLPYSENFEAYTGATSTSASVNNLPYCWNHLNSGTNTSYSGYPIIYTSATYAASGSNAIRFYTYTTSGTYGDQMAILPQIDPTLYPVSNLQLSFLARNNSTYTFTVVVGVISNPIDMTTFVPVDTIVTTSNAYTEYEVAFNQYTGPEGFIAMVAPQPGSSYNSGYIDNVMVDLIPTCPKPKNVASSNSTLTSIDLSWTEMGSANNWNIEYGPTGFTLGSGSTVTATTNPFTVTGLDDSQLYDFYIQADCGGGDLSGFTPVYTAGTECAAVVSLPFTENFDSISGYTTTSAAVNNLPYCWGTINAGTSTSYSGYPIVYTSATYAASGSNSMRFYTYSTSGTYDDQMVVLPEIDPTVYPMNNIQLSFDARSNSTYTFTLYVGVMTNPTDKTTFVPIDTIVTTSNAYGSYEIPFNQYTGTGSYIALLAPKPNSSTYNSGYIDNIMVDVIPTCPKPTGVTASNSTLNSIDLSWTEMGTATSWEIEYGPMGFTQGTGTIESASTNPYTISGLEASTGYDFYVRATCGGDDNSYWTLKTTAATTCAPVSTLPIVENFDLYPGYTTTTAATNNLPYCWSHLNAGTSSSYTGYPMIYASATYAASGDNSIRFYTYSTSGTYDDQIAILPQIDVTTHPMNTLQISFDARNYSSYTFKLVVGVMTDPTNKTTFVPMDTIITTSNTYSNYVVMFDQYTGTGSYIALMATKQTSSYNSGYVDNVMVELIPTCPRPTDFMATSSVTDEVVLSWTDTHASMWDILYGPTGFDLTDPSAGTLVSGVTTNPYSVSGLAPGIYDFYVRADCGAGDLSEWSISPATAAPYTYMMGVTGSDTVTGCGFVVTDDGGLNGDYSNNCNYTLVIFPSEVDSVLSVSGTFVGETSVDYLSVYNGTEVDEINLLQKIVSGTSGTLINFGPLTSTSGPLTLLFHSDGSVVKEGFAAQVTCVEAPSCPQPYDIHAADVSNNEATIAWSVMDGASYTSFNVVIGNYPAFDPDTCTNVINVNTTDYTFTGLSSYTNYYVRVQTDCGNDESDWSNAYAFRTACDPIVTLPYSENFESTTGSTTTSVSVNNLPYCWSNINAGTSTSYSGYPMVYASATYAASGSNAMRFYTFSTSGTYDDQIAVLPLIDPLMYPVNTLQLSFDARANTTSYTFVLVVGVLNNPADKSTFVAIDTLELTSTSYQTFELPLSQYQGTGNYIAIMAPQPASGYNYGYVDNVVVDLLPACPKPTNFTATALTSNSVVLSWVENGDATSWEIEYGAHGFTPGGTAGTVVQVTDNPYLLDNLTSSTEYDIYVRSDCGGDYSPYATVLTVLTACDPIDSLPFTENFDSHTGATTTSVSTNNLPYCWSHINVGTSTSYSGYPIIYTSATYAQSGSNSMRFYTYTTAGTYDDQVAVLPLIDSVLFPLNTLMLSFDARSNATTYTFKLVVGVLANPADMGTFTPLDTLLFPTTSYQNVEVYLNQYQGTSGYIAIVAPQPTTGYNYGYVDNVLVDVIPTCPKPTQIHAVNIGTNSIELGWTESGTASNWEIEYGPAGFAPGAGTVVSVTTNPYTVTGLTASTMYDFYVKSDCGGGDSSARSMVFTVATECAAIDALPYTENFDAYGTGESAYPICWGKINTYTSNRPYCSATAYAGSASLYFYAGTSGTYNIAVTPEFAASVPVNTLQATFMYRANGVNDRLIVGVMTNPTDASTFVPVDTILPGTTASAWEEREVVFSNYTGNGHYIAFKNAYTSAVAYAYIDNLYINLIPSCPKPHNAAATDVTVSSVTLDWTPMGSETSWEIAYGDYGFDPDGATATVVPANTHPFTVQNLNDASTYEFYVRANCGGTEHSYWSNAVAAATLCNSLVAVPYNENFEGYPGTTYQDANGIAPTCWTTYSTNTTYGAPHITSSGSYHYVHSGTNCMVFTCGAAGSDAYAALPTFTHPLNTLTLNFWRAMESATNGSTLTVGYVTDLNDLDSSFVLVATIPSVTSTNGDTISVDFTGADIPANGNICFHWFYSTSFYSCCIDDISVTSNSSAPVVTVATNNATAVGETTATLNATITNPDNETIAAKGFEWKTTTGGTYTQITGTGTGNTFTADLTGLTPNTSYTFKAFVTYNGETLYGSEKTFTTLESTVEPCDVPTGLTATDIQGESVTITWNSDANVSSWNIQYRPTGGQLSTATSNTNSYTITGLTNNTTYEIQVQANCGDGNLSDWSQAISVTTTGIGSWLENSVSLYPNPAKEYVDIRVDGDLNVTTMEVYDVYGKVVRTVVGANDYSPLPTRINIAGLADGMYFVRVTTEAGVVTKTFVKK